MYNYMQSILLLATLIVSAYMYHVLIHISLEQCYNCF